MPRLPPRKRWYRLRIAAELPAVHEALTRVTLSARIGEDPLRDERKTRHLLGAYSRRARLVSRHSPRAMNMWARASEE